VNTPPAQPFRIPVVAHPEAYVGLYVYDFRTHVGLGYTALEIRYLRESEAHRHGTAYEIYRATEGGGFELRGARDERLAAREAMCFLRADPAAARRDYEALCNAARQNPLPCQAELRLATVQAFEPPSVTAIVYAAAASHAVSRWLNRCAFDGGDCVVGGIDVCSELLAAERAPVESCHLPTAIDYRDRSWEEVLRTTDRPVQR
jgi:hypothetical protein